MKAESAAVCPFCTKNYKVPLMKGEREETPTIRRLLILDIHLLKIACEQGSDALKGHINSLYPSMNEGFQAKQSWVWSQIGGSGDSRCQ